MRRTTYILHCLRIHSLRFLSFSTTLLHHTLRTHFSHLLLVQPPLIHVLYLLSQTLSTPTGDSDGSSPPDDRERIGDGSGSIDERAKPSAEDARASFSRDTL